MERMEHSPIRRVRARREGELSSSSRNAGEHGAVQEGERPQRGEDTRDGGREVEGNTFPRLNPGGLFTDRLSSMEGEEPVDAMPAAPEEARRRQDRRDNEHNIDGDSTDLLQRTKKRKRGSPEPAPRGAGSTASFFWRTLQQPPRTVPRARGRGGGRGRRQGTSSEDRGEAESDSGTACLRRRRRSRGGRNRREKCFQMMKKSTTERSTIKNFDTPWEWGAQMREIQPRLVFHQPPYQRLVICGHHSVLGSTGKDRLLFLRIVSQMMEEVGYGYMTEK